MTWARRITIICMYGGEARQYDAQYSIYDYQSNPSIDLQLCMKCHQSRQAGHASDCPTITHARREHKDAAREHEKIVKGMFASFAQEAKLLTPPTPCPDFVMGMCRAQKQGECTKGAHGNEEEAKKITCNICKPRGLIKDKFKALQPPWTYCIQGPRCIYDHAGWTKDNGMRALRLRDEAQRKAEQEAA